MMLRPKPETGQGVLQVAVTTALGAYPIEGAQVTVSGAHETEGAALYHAAVTDKAGLTPALALPAPPRALSEVPQDRETPFALYAVQVDHPDYTPVARVRVAVFDGVTSTLPVELTPLPENETDAPQEVTAIAPPPDL